MLVGYKLEYKCMQAPAWQTLICDNKRELYGYLGDMRRYLTDYKITRLERITEFELVTV